MDNHQHHCPSPVNHNHVNVNPRPPRSVQNQFELLPMTYRPKDEMINRYATATIHSRRRHHWTSTLLVLMAIHQRSSFMMALGFSHWNLSLLSTLQREGQVRSPRYLNYVSFGEVCRQPQPSRRIRCCYYLRSTMDDCNDDSSPSTDRTVTILQRGPNHIIALKPPSVVCHHSGWTGSRAKLKCVQSMLFLKFTSSPSTSITPNSHRLDYLHHRRGEEPEIPMLQRVREALHDIGTRDLPDEQKAKVRKVNLVHRLDRGASGCLLLAYADDDGAEVANASVSGSTAMLIDALASPESTKTYVALVRGEGILREEDFKTKGWFNVTRPIKDESGEEKDATTWFNFVAGQPETVEDGIERPRMSLVLARPMQGRWHQIRKHLNGISHPILGDTTHGASTVNREWKEKRNLPGERICLHLARLQLPPTEAVPEGIDVCCPLLDDMLDMLRVYAPDVLEESLPTLREEGILVETTEQYEVGQYSIPEELLQQKVEDDGKVEILDQGENYVIASKPASVIVHHSSWTGKRSDPKRRWKEATPMLQRVRDATGRRVNLVHRLDR